MTSFPYRIRYIPEYGWEAQYQYKYTDQWYRVPNSSLCLTRWGAKGVLRRYVRQEQKRNLIEYYSKDSLLGINGHQ